jgi:hypothetical protein
MQTFYIFSSQTGNFIGTRGIAPEPESDEIGILQTPETLAQLMACFVPKLSNGQIVEGATPEQIEATKPALLSRIYDKYESLFDSSLARALNKPGQGLTRSQLTNLRDSYELKKDVALSIINGNVTNTTIANLIQFECDVDFAEPRLQMEVAYLNSEFQANIPTENVTRLYQYCFLIIAKYNIGAAIWSQLKSLCESFRSKMITDVEQNAFNRLHARFALIDTITNETTVAEIMQIEQQFNAIPN